MSNATKIAGFITTKNYLDRIAPIPSSFLSETKTTGDAAIQVQTNRQFQTIEGFGGAFTEAAATTLYKMPKPVQRAIIDAYFNAKTGHGYTFCRTHINSCDFSLGNYAYVDTPGDTELTSFSIDRDRKALIPFIRSAMDTAQNQLKILASPWSPPAWMKTNGQMNHGGKLKTEFAKTWAKYYCKYIQEYSVAGIPIWGISVQNEPAANQVWDSCLYTAEEERDFVRDHLGPALEDADLPHIKLVIWDHNRDKMYERAKVVYEDPEAAKFVWGTGFHWYGDDHFENVQKLYDAFPNKKLIFTEGCQEGGPHIGSWDLGERYAISIINDLNRGTVAWIDWNLILDEQGGPNHMGNYCSAPIIADTNSGKCIYQSSYYYLGHFSRFIRPGSVRVFSKSTIQDLQVLSVVTPDKKIVIVIMNSSDKQIPFNLCINQNEQSIVSPPHSIMTLISNP
ncbi:MAG: glycoside hydrolase family 30 protein [Candidatus Marinimicrobia bacterium]|nr:glycoside hydrolase family 30 protein [Candidatus Neomarinimicrobiota bacterium]